MQPIDQQTELLFPDDAGAPPLPARRPPEALDLDWTASAWPRWFARSFDVWWQTGLVALVLGSILCRFSPAFLAWIDTPFGWKLFGLACIPVGLLLDAAVHAVAGNTPGKALLGLHLLTLDGRRPGLKELVRRNLHLWSAGLGLGLPAVGLATMARQGLRLRKGKGASYDERAFMVRAMPVGRARKLVFGLAFCALFVLIVALDAADRQDSRETAVLRAALPASWTNPATGRSVPVAPQWTVEERSDDDDKRSWLFTQHSGHALVLLAYEDHAGQAFRYYARALAEHMAERMDHDLPLPGGRFEHFRGHPSWRGAGEGRREPVRVQLRIVQVDGQAWRVLALQSPPAAYTDDLVQELQGALWDSVIPPPAPKPTRVATHQ